MGPHFFDPKLTQSKLFQTEHTRRLACLPSFCELVLMQDTVVLLFSCPVYAGRQVGSYTISFCKLRCSFMVQCSGGSEVQCNVVKSGRQVVPSKKSLQSRILASGMENLSCLGIGYVGECKSLNIESGVHLLSKWDLTQFHFCKLRWSSVTVHYTVQCSGV